MVLAVGLCLFLLAWHYYTKCAPINNFLSIQITIKKTSSQSHFHWAQTTLMHNKWAFKFQDGQLKFKSFFFSTKIKEKKTDYPSKFKIVGVQKSNQISSQSFFIEALDLRFLNRFWPFWIIYYVLQWMVEICEIWCYNPKSSECQRNWFFSYWGHKKAISIWFLMNLCLITKIWFFGI